MFTQSNPIPTYSLAEIKQLMMQENISMSTFYRLAAEQSIGKYLSDGQQRGASWNKVQVDALLRNRKQSGKKSIKIRAEIEAQENTVPITQINLENIEAATDWIQYEDELNAYGLDCQLYGFENSVSPDITWTWWQKNPHACRILYNKNDRNELWGLLSIIPMEEEIIFQLLRDEMSEKDIRSEHVLTFEPGKHYSCYVAAISMRADHRHSFGKLLSSVMEYWCEHHDVYIDKLFAFALGGEKSSGMRLIRRMFFWPRRDISSNAWELDLTVFNPNPAIEEYRQCIDDARSGKTRQKFLSLQSLATAAGSDTEPVPVTLERATETDITSVLQISAAIYGNSGTPFERRAEWLKKNPEYLYVARQHEERIIGYASIMPLAQKQIRRILSEEIHPGDIIAEDLKAFIPGQVIDIYIASVAMLPGLPQEIDTKCGFELVKHLMDFFVDLGARGIIIDHIFARSRTVDGVKLLTRLGFTEITSTAPSSQRHFMIDVDLSGLHFIKQYKKALQNKEK